MNTTVHNKLISFIWSIADDCLRDIYVRGKYRDVILPMVVLRRLDALLEPTKKEVLAEVAFQQNEAELTLLDSRGLCQASGYIFYNTSKWTLQQLKDTATNSQQILATNVIDYLNGFSDNVKEIIEKFKLRDQIYHMANKDVLLGVLEKFTSPTINLTPFDKLDPDGRRLPALTNLGMGYVFEELIRKFNEENNEEAGEHFTPREVIDLMTHIIFEPVKDRLPNIIKIYDPACGSGGMLTESQNFIKDEEGTIRATESDIYLYGKEINDETYAICKSDMMIKGNNPENIRNGSTLSTDEFAGQTFDFMLSNPPYGKSWANEVKNIKDGKEIIDTRFDIILTDLRHVKYHADATPRTSDGQLLFLMEMVSKMNPDGSRIASVHNGSSLFTGDAGSGESNIRRYIIENDWLECIIQLPNNIFYNTGITTYIWIVCNKKPDNRVGKVQLIDAGQLYRKLRKNLGNKNCELTPSHINEILQTYLRMSLVERTSDDSIASLIFDNSDFGYKKVTIERPKRLKAQFSRERIAQLRFDRTLREPMEWAYNYYLDQKTSQIDKAITQKEQIIELLKERKQILINKAVTKGLNPDAPLKDSGIDWIGKIPEHWQIRRLKNSIEMIVSNVDKHIKKTEKQVRLCNYVDVYKNDFIDKKIPFMIASATEDEMKRYKISIDDVIITKDSEDWRDIGIPAWVKYEAEDLLCGYHLAILRPQNIIFAGYLFRLLQSINIKIQFSVKANGVTRCGLSHNAILDSWIIIPPLSEQQQISDYLEEKCTKITTAITQKHLEIEKLREYKATLIDSAVTGKICLTDK